MTGRSPGRPSEPEPVPVPVPVPEQEQVQEQEQEQVQEQVQVQVQEPELVLEPELVPVRQGRRRLRRTLPKQSSERVRTANWFWRSRGRACTRSWSRVKVHVAVADRACAWRCRRVSQSLR
jgi:hypothetical protein